MARLYNLCEYLQYLRIKYISPYLVGGKRDMFLLKNGHWIDINIRTSHTASEIDFFYDAAKHAIFKIGDSPKTVRWPWLSVIVDGHIDISEFFSSLRITARQSLSQQTVLMLYAHQNGVLYTQGLEIIEREF